MELDVKRMGDHDWAVFVRCVPRSASATAYLVGDKNRGNDESKGSAPYGANNKDRTRRTTPEHTIALIHITPQKICNGVRVEESGVETVRQDPSIKMRSIQRTGGSKAPRDDRYLQPQPHLYLPEKSARPCGNSRSAEPLAPKHAGESPTACHNRKKPGKKRQKNIATHPRNTCPLGVHGEATEKGLVVRRCLKTDPVVLALLRLGVGHVCAQRRNARAVVLRLMLVAVAGGGDRIRAGCSERSAARGGFGSEESVLASYMRVERDRIREGRRKTEWRRNRGERRGSTGEESQGHEGKREAGGRTMLERHDHRRIRKRSEVPRTKDAIEGQRKAPAAPSYPSRFLCAENRARKRGALEKEDDACMKERASRDRVRHQQGVKEEVELLEKEKRAAACGIVERHLPARVVRDELPPKTGSTLPPRTARDDYSTSEVGGAAECKEVYARDGTAQLLSATRGSRRTGRTRMEHHEVGYGVGGGRANEMALRAGGSVRCRRGGAGWSGANSWGVPSRALSAERRIASTARLHKTRTRGGYVSFKSACWRYIRYREAPRKSSKWGGRDAGLRPGNEWRASRAAGADGVKMGNRKRRSVEDVKPTIVTEYAEKKSTDLIHKAAIAEDTEMRRAKWELLAHKSIGIRVKKQGRERPGRRNLVTTYNRGSRAVAK
ncbi:hypothetical protein B0H19DRAFT_1231837 [Mycena capillaripes]|nr:hypothetical protein B0H19DRAFT_1231837 [Mycena capillaripes]